MGMMFIDRNFIDASILSVGGFTVMLDVLDIAGGDDPANRFGGFGLGMTRDEVSSLQDATSTSNISMRTLVGGGATAISDFFIDLAMDGKLRAWTGSTLLAAYDVQSISGRIRVDFLFPNFNLNQTVVARIYFNGQQQGLVLFDWDHNNQNYIGFSARATTYIRMDNLVIMPYENLSLSNADITGEGNVNLFDFSDFAKDWLDGYVIPCPGGDLNGDCAVNIKDLMLLAQYWLQ